MSAFTKLGKEKLKEIIDNSSFISDVFDHTSISPLSGSGNYKSFYKAVEIFSLQNELDALKKRSSLKRKSFLSNLALKKGDIDSYLCENSTKYSKDIKKLIIKNHLIKYECAWCGLTNTYNGKPLTLQLDHINGINNDNRLENLRFLCPNCHSQTETWGGKNVNKDERAQNQLNRISKKEANLKQREQLFEERKRDVYSQNLTKYGWVTKLANKWCISRTQTRRWIKKNLPEIPLFESTSKNITPQILEDRKKEKEKKKEEKEKLINFRKNAIRNCNIDFSKYGWQTELGKLLDMDRRRAAKFFYKFFKEEYPNVYKREKY